MARRRRTVGIVQPPRGLPRFVNPRGWVVPKRRTMQDLTQFEDRRVFHPAGPLRPAFSFTRAARRLVIPRVKRSHVFGNTLSARLKFAEPRKVLACVRRGIRREIVFALGKSGKGSRARKRRRNNWSDVSC